MNPSKISLFLLDECDADNISSWFFIDWEKLEIEDLEIYITEDGYNIEHELIELDLLETTLQTEPKVAEYDWLTCRIIFHRITDKRDIPEHISPHE